MDDWTESRLRDTLAWLRCHATDDTEGIKVLVDHCDLEQLAQDTATIALLFVGAITEDPTAHLDRLYVAAGLRYGDKP